MAKYQYKVKGVDYEVEIQDIEGNIANVTVNGIPFEVEMKQPVKLQKKGIRIPFESISESCGIECYDPDGSGHLGTSKESVSTF